MAVAVPAQLESLNPATGEPIGSVPITPPEEVQGVVDAVAKVQPFWAELTLRDRALYLERAAQVVIDEGDDIRDLIVREQGKPRNEAFSMEILPTIDALHWIARAGQEILADEKIPMPQVFLKTKRSAFTYEPLGVIGIVSPWNYPWSIPFGEVALALMAGNGVVLKPASLTALIGDRIQRVFERAGVPEGLVRVLHGPGTGPALVSSTVAKVFFTGSVETGRGVGEACARQLKGSVLELGGKDPMIVLPDANLDHAIAGALWGGFANAGQTCSGIERVYVMREVSERFIAGVVAGAQRLRVGDPMSWDTEIGPMVSPSNTAPSPSSSTTPWPRARRCSAAARRRRPPVCSEGSFYAPTVLTGVTHDMRIMREEIFGPVLPDRRRRLRGRGGGAGQRLTVRPRGVGVDERSRQGRADRPRARDRDGLDQRSHVQPRRLPVLVGRGQGLRRRAHPLEVRALRVRQRQAPRVGGLGGPQRLVAPVRRDARQGPATDRDDPLRPALDPGAGAEGGRRAVAQARRAAGPRR